MQLRFPVSDVRPAWIDGSAGARPAHSNLPALYSSPSHPPFVSTLHLFFFPTTEICHSLLCCLNRPLRSSNFQSQLKGCAYSMCSISHLCRLCGLFLLWHFNQNFHVQLRGQPPVSSPMQLLLEASNAEISVRHRLCRIEDV